MLRCHRTALNTGSFEVVNLKMKRNTEWKDESLNNSISLPCRVKTGLLWPPSPAAVDRAVLCLWSPWSHCKQGSWSCSYLMPCLSILRIAVTKSWLLFFVGTVLVSRRACKEKNHWRRSNVCRFCCSSLKNKWYHAGFYVLHRPVFTGGCALKVFDKHSFHLG